MDAFLSAQNIVKRYAQHTALDGVSINIERGTVFGLLGPNGCLLYTSPSPRDA